MEGSAGEGGKCSSRVLILLSQARGEKKVCEISLYRKLEISDTTDLAHMNASYMGEWL